MAGGLAFGCYTVLVVFTFGFLLRPGGFSRWGFVQTAFVMLLTLVGTIGLGFSRDVPRDAISVDVDDMGIAFEFAKGPPWKVRWEDPKLELSFYFTPHRPVGNRVLPESIVAYDRKYTSHVTYEVYRAILEEATRLHLTVREGLPSPRPGTRTLISRS